MEEEDSDIFFPGSGTVKKIHCKERIIRGVEAPL
jgi:hypothetical protein